MVSASVSGVQQLFVLAAFEKFFIVVVVFLKDSNFFFFFGFLAYDKFLIRCT